MKKYFTTTLPYPNDDLHLGHVLENVGMDARVRFERMRGAEVLFNTGVDEYGTKIKMAAEKAGKDPQQFVDEMSNRFRKTLESLSIEPDLFTRTTSERHRRGVEAFWRVCMENGWIYKEKHRGSYCVGCEFFITEKDLNTSGVCPLHPTLMPELVEEENYFFRLSLATELLKSYYSVHPDAIIPRKRRNEVFAFLHSGLHDISISRDASRLDWGVPVPGDPTQVVYVWFDALTNYISTIGWPNDEEWKEWWPVVQSAGKDNLKPQCIIWQAMLFAAGISFSGQIYIHGFVNDKDGKKMSKTLGNGITPQQIIDEYSTELLRFLMVMYINPFEDTSFSLDKVREIYNDDLVNGIGNATARVLTLSQKYLSPPSEIPEPAFPEEYIHGFEGFDFRLVAQSVRDAIRAIDAYMTETKPFATVKTDPEQAQRDIAEARDMLVNLAHLITPIIPKTAECILDSIQSNTPPPPLFPRKEEPASI